jgi:hypothetical protein
MQYTARDAVLDAFGRLEEGSGRSAFRTREIVDEVKREHPEYRDSTVQTYVVSVMCVDAPVHHANHTDDLRRVDRGLYERVDRMESTSRKSPVTEQREPMASHAPDSGDAHLEWHWEGNIQAAMVSYLAGEGWGIKSVADTAAREHGVDILADKDGRRIAVEVKGYPSLYYVRGPKQGERKKTPPSIQARVWYSDLLLSMMLLLNEGEHDQVVMCLPAVGTYESLVDRTKQSLECLGVVVVFVDDSDAVSTIVGAL